jgi:hypothetical protein
MLVSFRDRPRIAVFGARLQADSVWGNFESKSFVCQSLSTPGTFYNAWAMFLTNMSYQSLTAFLPPLGALFIAGQCHGVALASNGF